MSKSISKRKFVLLYRLFLAFEELRLTDIPDNMIIRKQKIAYQGVHLQAPFLDMFKSVKTAFEVGEKEYHFLLTKVNSNFQDD
jgi:hypothetical protein